MYLNKNAAIIVCCNNEIAFPAIARLLQRGVLKAVVVPDNNKDIFQQLQQFLSGSAIELVSVNKKNLVEKLTQLIEKTKASYCWTMTFPYLIPKLLLDSLPNGFINFHYGILPQFRGPNPILAHMLQQETHSGLTVHIIDEGIDTGPLLLQHKIPIEPRDTFGIQCSKLASLGAAMADQLLQVIIQGLAINPVQQDESLANYYKKPTAKDLMINWNTMTSDQVLRMIMSCNPWNKGAGTMINNQVVCLVDGEISGDASTDLDPGTIADIGKNQGLQIVCCDHKIVRINIIYTADGFFEAYGFSLMGYKQGDRFVSINN